MTSSSYLQRIVARMGTPAAGIGPLFTPPDAPAPAVFDPFADAEPLDAEIAPPLEPRAAAPPQPLPHPTIMERSELQPPGEVVERVIHEVTEPSLVVPVEPLQAQPPAVNPPLPQPAPSPESEQIAPPIEVTAWETLTQIVRQFVAPAQDEEPPAFERPIAPVLQPVLEPEIAERIRYEFVEPPRQTAPISPVEPPLEVESPAVAPVFDPPAPQITIGDIVVEIVTRPEAQGRTSAPPPPRATAPVEPPAPLRAGVRSKRGYGIGQM